MNRHTELFQNVRKRTGMYVFNETYESVAGFVSGYNAACEGGTLVGFREWLVLRAGFGENLGWPSLVLHAAFPEAEDPEKELGTPSGERHAIDTLFDLIEEFDQVTSQRDGLQKIFLAMDALEKS